jgi:SAM-dependent methyltransferase
MSDLAKRIVGHYERHALAWDGDRQNSPWNDKSWHDRFIEVLPKRAMVLDLGCGGGRPVAQHFCADSTKNLDQIMTDAEAQDWELKELISEGHLISVKNGTHGKTIEFDPSENAYKVSVSGLNHPVRVIQQFVTATQ